MAARRYPVEIRRLVLLGRLDGRTSECVATEFSVSTMTVRRICGEPEVMADVYAGSGARLGLADREVISRGIAAGRSARSIAVELGRSPSTVTREIDRNGGREDYRAYRAHAHSCVRARRQRPTVFELNPLLAGVVEDWLENKQWSPRQISARLCREFPDDETMRVAAETIYQGLYVYGRGGLRKELSVHLRTHRDARRPHAVTARNKAAGVSIPNLVSIAERPEEVNDRLVPGHWEGDLIMGKDGRSQVLTLVERTTGLVMLGQLDNKRAPTIADRLGERIQTLPAVLCGSVTWDRGTEMADHARFTVATGVNVYFCDPRSPWQRGSNENTNGLLRQYLPRTADLSQFTQADLEVIADKLNNRPRARHKFMTPLEVFDQLVLH